MTEKIVSNLIIYSFLVSACAIVLFKPLAVKIGLVDVPCTRKRHDGAIPLIGGLAIFASIAAGLLTYELLNPFNTAFLIACSLLVVIGVIDDYKDIHVLPRFLVQIIASLVMIYLGHVEINSLGNLFGTGEIRLGEFAKPFTVFAVVGGINAFNMLDGVDGLAGTLALFIFLILATLCNDTVFSNIASLSLMFVAALAGFLMFNARVFGRKASVFLGDTGSTLLGFGICWFLIATSQGPYRVIEPATALWIIAVPLMDTVCIMFRRLLQKRSPFSPDREHFHHILSLAGFGANGTVALMLCSSVLFACIGIMGEYVLLIDNYVLFYLFICAFACYMWGMCQAWKSIKNYSQAELLEGLRAG